MPIKVLVISGYSDIHSSRPEAEIYVGLAKSGLDVEIMTIPDSPYTERFESVGIHIIEFSPKKKFDKKEIAFIRQTLVEGKHDILHLYSSTAIINGIRAAKKLPVKVVLYRGVPGHIHWYDPSSYVKYLHPRVDKIVCNAKAVEDVLHEQLFFDKSKAITINKGHLTEWYQGTKPINREELGVSDDDFVVVFVGNNRPMKGVPYLLEAFNYISEELPIHLVIVGRGMDTAINKQITDESPNKEKIHFLGFRDDALSIIAASNTLVLSSIIYESITKSVIEAMSLGIPVILTDIPGNRTLNGEKEKANIVVPIKDAKAIANAILKLYHNPQECIEIGKNGIKFIDEKLSNKRTIIEMKALYENLASK